MKLSNKKRLWNVCSWLKSMVSLSVIMGLTWLLGLLIVEEKIIVGSKVVVPLAYIFTLMMALQGIFIFLIFILFSRVVQEAYIKCWRTKVNESEVLSKIFGDKTIGISESSSKKKVSKCINTNGLQNSAVLPSTSKLPLSPLMTSQSQLLSSPLYAESLESPPFAHIKDTLGLVNLPNSPENDGQNENNPKSLDRDFQVIHMTSTCEENCEDIAREK